LHHQLSSNYIGKPPMRQRKSNEKSKQKKIC
jgi:hypothetical protein